MGAPASRGPAGTCTHRLAGALDACGLHVGDPRLARRNNEAHPGDDSHTRSAGRRRHARAGRRRKACAHAGACPAGGGHTGPARRADQRLPAERWRGHAPIALCACAQRGLAGVAGRPAAGPARRPWRAHLPDADAGDVRELPAGPRDGARAEHARAVRGRGAGAPGPVAGAAADLPGRVRLSGVRAPGRAARPGPVYAHRRRSADRPGVQVRRMAVPALALRPAVHAGELRDSAAGACRRPVGVQGCGGHLQPRRGGPDRAHVCARGPVGALGDGVRGPEPCPARAGGGGRAQRHAAAAAAGWRACAVHRRESARARGRPRACGGRGSQGHCGACAAVLGARAGALARAPASGGERSAEPGRGGDRGGDRVWHPYAGLPRRGRRTTAAGCDA